MLSVLSSFSLGRRVSDANTLDLSTISISSIVAKGDDLLAAATVVLVMLSIFEFASYIVRNSSTETDDDLLEIVAADDIVFVSSVVSKIADNL